MPFALVIFGLIMVVTAAKGTHVALGNQLVKDFTGPGNFVYWFIAIGVIAAVGQVPSGQKVAKPFLILVLSAMVLANKGFFAQFMSAVKTGPVASPREALTGGTSATAASGTAANTDLASLSKTAMNVAAFVA